MLSSTARWHEETPQRAAGAAGGHAGMAALWRKDSHPIVCRERQATIAPCEGEQGGGSCPVWAAGPDRTFW